MKFICDVRQVADLFDGETASPKPDRGYELRSIAGDTFESSVVECLVRRGDCIYARTMTGEEFAVTGTNAHVLVPLAF
ncbi:hypothetical protein [Novipirellula artificiosorum]|uniref:Uncharacterized protein n=1 Tax=Novipirellula artificiosorum TaxID=2528016 RepID=A0A5C6DPY9_9BACT|nr:hypothetical protein [Novipirellula artificiosorum]TWU39343.1 hypothetical protein Poly41_21670 [Novipirellula artificiosorum]